MKHETIEKNSLLMIVLIVVVISFGGLAEILPLMHQHATMADLPNVKPLTPLELEGRDVYIREGCHVCHTQMIRPLAWETERYGPYSRAAESKYEHPFLWGSKRTGPDLARIGRRYSDAWHRLHLHNPRDVVPESNMPGYPWLEKTPVETELIEKKMRAFRLLGAPYSETDITQARNLLQGKTEMDALVAYLQQLGTAVDVRAGS